MRATFGPGCGPLSGSVRVPGDKSLSHRAVLFAAMAQGRSTLSGILDSEDVRATIGAVEALGAVVQLTPAEDGSLSGTVDGWGERGPRSPGAPIYCGNSGTTARLLMGVIAGWPIEVTLTGDASLSSRPMRRVTEPLSAMGASFEATEEGTLPVTVHGRAGLKPLNYVSPVASAQVKTAVLLAGLRASGGVRVTEPARSRDHTERLLPAFGVAVKVDPDADARLRCAARWCLKPLRSLCRRTPPRRRSSRLRLLLVPGSRVSLTGVSLNETRTGFVRVLQRMGASVGVTNTVSPEYEPAGDMVVAYSAAMRATAVESHEVPSLVDEVPILALAASAAVGTTRFEGVSELRVKESDRLAAVAEGLGALGVDVRTGPDWLEVDGPSPLHGAALDSLGDHRLAMTWAIAGLVADGPVTIERFDAVDVSYPGFAA